MTWGPWWWARAVGNLRDRILVGPLADLRPMPRVAVDVVGGDARPDRPAGPARDGAVTTYRYAADPAAPSRGAPVLLVPPLGGCGAAFDLRRGCSLVEHLVGEGRRVYQVEDEDIVGCGDEELPTPPDLARWVDDLLPHVVRTVSDRHDGAPVHLVGWSIGGLVATLGAAAHPDLPVASVTAFATPFALGLVPTVLPTRPLALSAGGSLLATTQTLLGLLPGSHSLGGIGLGELDTLLTTPLTVLAHCDDRDFLAQLEAVDDLRAHLGHRERLVGRAFHELVDPAAVVAGRVPVGDRTVSFADLRRPVLLLAGESDVVVPPRSVRAGTGVLTRTATSLNTGPGGHLGVLTGRGARARTWPVLCAFLDRHDPPGAPPERSRPAGRGASSPPRSRAGERSRRPAPKPAARGRRRG